MNSRLLALFMVVMYGVAFSAPPGAMTQVHEGQVQALPHVLERMSTEAQSLLADMPSEQSAQAYVDSYINRYMAGFLPSLVNLYTHPFTTNSTSFPDGRSLSFGHLDARLVDAFIVKDPGTVQAGTVTAEHAYLNTAVAKDIDAYEAIIIDRLPVTNNVSGGEVLFNGGLKAGELSTGTLSPLGGSSGYIFMGNNRSRFTGDVYVLAEDDLDAQSRGLVAYRDHAGGLWHDPRFVLSWGNVPYVRGEAFVEHTVIPEEGASGFAHNIKGLGEHPNLYGIPSLTFPPILASGLYTVDAPATSGYRARALPVLSAGQPASMLDVPPLFDIPEFRYLFVWVSVYVIADDLFPEGALMSSGGGVYLFPFGAEGDTHAFYFDLPKDEFLGRRVLSRETTLGYFYNGTDLCTGEVGHDDYYNPDLPHGAQDYPNMVDIVVTLRLQPLGPASTEPRPPHFPPKPAGPKGFLIEAVPRPPTGGSTTGSGRYPAQAAATLTGTAAEGFEFLRWEENGVVVWPPLIYEFVVTGNRFLEAVFTDEYEVTTSSLPVFGGRTAGDGTYKFGDFVTLWVDANDGYVFDKWMEGVYSTTENPVTVQVKRRMDFVAVFSPIPYNIHTRAIPVEGGLTFGGGLKDYDSLCEVVAQPAYGYSFVNWTEGGQEVLLSSRKYRFFVTRERYLQANFKKESYYITTASSDVVAGSVSGGGIYEYKETCTVTASASSGHVFSNWTVDGVVVSYNPEYTFEVVRGGHLVAHFEPITFVVTTGASPSEGGFVSPGGTFAMGDEVVVTADAFTGYEFSGWYSGATQLSTSASFSFLIDRDLNLTAKFIVDGYLVTLVTGPNGTATGQGRYGYRDTVSITASAGEGYMFVGWSEPNKVAIFESSPTYTFQITNSVTFEAHFEPKQRYISTGHSPEGAGTTSGGGAYDIGSTCTLRARGVEGYSFVGWAEDGTNVSNKAKYSFNVINDRSLTAVFTNQCVVVTVADPSSAGTTTGDGEYVWGELCTVSATPAEEGYLFVGWVDSGTLVSRDLSYTFEVLEDTVMIARYAPTEHVVTTAPSHPERGSASGSGVYNHGDSCTITAEATADYAFAGWTDRGELFSKEPSFTFEVKDSHELIANFVDAQYVIETSSSPEGYGIVSGGGVYDYMEVCTVVATPAPGHVFVNWTQEGVEVSKETTYVFVVEEDWNLVANFERIVYTVALTATMGTAYGTVSGGGEFYYGDICTILATPVSPYVASGWWENSTKVYDGAAASFSVTNNRALHMVFTAPRYRVDMRADPAAGGEARWSSDYLYNEWVTAVATPSYGYTFLGWTEGGTNVSNKASYQFQVKRARDLVAHFKNRYTINVVAEPRGGAITVSGGGVFGYGETCVLTYSYPSWMPQSERPAFIAWGEGLFNLSSSPVYSFTVTKDMNIWGRFQGGYTVITTPNPFGGGVTTGGGTYTDGYWDRKDYKNPVFVPADPCTVVATPNEGYVFVRWRVGEEVVSRESSYTFDVTGDIHLEADFADERVAYITAIADPADGGAVTGGGYYFLGEVCTLKATPTSGSEFIRWVEGAGPGAIAASAEETFSFVVEEVTRVVDGQQVTTADRTFVATFLKLSEALYITYSWNSSYPDLDTATGFTGTTGVGWSVPSGSPDEMSALQFPTGDSQTGGPEIIKINVARMVALGLGRVGGGDGSIAESINVIRLHAGWFVPQQSGPGCVVSFSYKGNVGSKSVHYIPRSHPNPASYYIGSVIYTLFKDGREQVEIR